MMGGNRIQMTKGGSTASLEKFLKMAGKQDAIKRAIDPVCAEGVRKLQAATPRDTSRTANAWSYEIVASSSGVTIYWKNSNMNKGSNIAMLIRYGHGTRNGGYVPANDFITPAMRGIFDQIADKAWKAVKKA